MALQGYAQRGRGEADFRFVFQFLGTFFLVPLVACSPSSSFKMNTVDDFSELESVFSEANLETRSIGGAALTKCQSLMAKAVTAAISDEKNDPPEHGIIGCALNRIHSAKNNQTAKVCDQRGAFDNLLNSALQSPDCVGVVKEPFVNLIQELKPIVAPLVSCINNNVNACIKPRSDGSLMSAGGGRRFIEAMLSVIRNELHQSINARIQGQSLDLTVLFQRLNALRLADHLYSGIIGAFQRSAVLAGSAIKNVPAQQTPLEAIVTDVSGALNSRSFGVDMKVKKPHQSLAGSVFVMALVQTNEGVVRYFLNSAFQWIKDDGVNAPPAFANKQALSIAFRAMIQQNVDLTGFVGTQAVVGYGVGSDAYSEMIASQRYANFYMVQP